MAFNSPAPDALLRRALGGDQSAIADLFTRDGVTARRALYDAIPAKYQSVLSLDDVMQQAYAEAVVNLPRFDDRGEGSFAAWLTQLARCTLLDALRMLDADKRGGGRHRVEAHTTPENSCANLFDML